MSVYFAGSFYDKSLHYSIISVRYCKGVQLKNEFTSHSVYKLAGKESTSCAVVTQVAKRVSPFITPWAWGPLRGPRIYF